MAEDVSAKRMHDRVTRGETITDAERLRLEAWYERQDAQEDALLNSSASPPSTGLEALRDEVASALTQLSSVTHQIQMLAEENEALRRDIVILHRRISHTAFPQAV